MTPVSTTRAIASMTGFGQAEAHVAGARVTVELKGVNHRYLDLAVKGPREYAALEPRLLELVRSRVKRGKVDVFVTRRPEASDPSAVRADVDLARGVHRALSTIAKELGLPADDISISTLAQWREIVTVGSGVAEPEADRA